MDRTETIRCRLCGAQSHYLFDKRLLGRLKVAYYRCSSCESQQTEVPTWLDEAYAIPGVHIDVGGGSRTLKNWLGASTLLSRLNFPKTGLAVDFGAASGLFARLMRDLGYDFFSYDKYARPAFTSYYLIDDFAQVRPNLITAFEVFEHLPEPKQTLELILSAGAELILFTTWFCDGQNEDWIYYLPECGQHVFFYSERSIREFADRFGYDMTISHFFMILAKRDAFDTRQRETIYDFSLNSLRQVAEATAETVGSVIMGNQYIERDLAVARARFERELKDDLARTL